MEMALFFKLRAPADLGTTAHSHFVYCKALAKGMPEPVCARLAKVTDDDLKMVYKPACGAPGQWNVLDNQTGKPIELLQLTRYTELIINGGRTIHNCVAGYHQRCAQNSCQIFSLRTDGERKATIEISGKKMVQARGNYNQSLEGYPLQCLRKWIGKFKLAEVF